MATRTLAWLTAFALLAGCGAKPPPEIQWHAFDGHRSYTDVERLVSFGPRPSGSEELAQAATYIEVQLRAAGLETEEQVFVASTPHGPMRFRNIIGKTRGGRSG